MSAKRSGLGMGTLIGALLAGDETFKEWARWEELIACHCLTSC